MSEEQILEELEDIKETLHELVRLTLEQNVLLAGGEPTTIGLKKGDIESRLRLLREVRKDVDDLVKGESTTVEEKYIKGTKSKNKDGDE